jgi:hypothetical protein
MAISATITGTIMNVWQSIASLHRDGPRRRGLERHDDTGARFERESIEALVRQQRDQGVWTADVDLDTGDRGAPIDPDDGALETVPRARPVRWW